MKKKAIILDLDNTIYSVHSIGHDLFHSLFELINKDVNHAENMDKIKDDVMRRPFQNVAKDYHFSENLIEEATHLLQHLSYVGPIKTFSDYEFIRHLQVDKFLVTTGFRKLQQSKIARMKIEADFKEIHIIDPAESSATKKDVFAEIMKRHGYNNQDILVIGDDLESEIKAAMELDIEALLFDRLDLHEKTSGIEKITELKQLVNYL